MNAKLQIDLSLEKYLTLMHIAKKFQNFNNLIVKAIDGNKLRQILLTCSYEEQKI